MPLAQQQTWKAMQLLRQAPCLILALKNSFRVLLTLMIVVEQEDAAEVSPS